jgi:MFS transporter, FHS family, L-fucose permease
LLPFAFFIAYGVMSIPAGMLIEKFHEKAVLLGAFILSFSGALIFALLPTYTISIISLFIIGAGMAMLQVVINPLLRATGGEEHFAFNSVMAQLVFGLASFISPMIYSTLALGLQNRSSDFFIRLFAGMVPIPLP